MKLDFRFLIKAGLLAGIALLYTSMVGMIEVFNEREIIHELTKFGDIELLTLGQIFVLLPSLVAGYVTGRKLKSAGDGTVSLVVSGIIVGAISTIPTLLLIIIGTNFNIRSMFVSVNNNLFEILLLGQDSAMTGSIYLVLLLMAMSIIGTSINLLPNQIRQAIVNATLWVLGVGVMSELFNQMLTQFREYGWIERDTVRVILQSGVVKSGFAAAIFIIAFLVTLAWPYVSKPAKQSYNNSPATTQRNVQSVGYLLVFVLLLALPWLVGRFLSDVMVTISLYVLMGLGLNIAVGWAGLLDLGYLTNFAMGAYVTGVLVSTGPLGIVTRTGGDVAFFNLWWLIPISLLAAMCTGFFFALPVLRMRGDYLAIATLGFGEIIAKLAISDWLKPIIGGAQGILFIPKPVFFGIALDSPERLYYVGLAACLFMLFIKLRLNNSRTGRQWMALREDEDAASAMGIDTIRTKIIAFTLSAAAGGLAGAIFATKVGTVFPNSFTVIVSINVLCLIIVGGMGSIPGVVVGAIVLVGLPEILREFAEFRFLMYGALLVTMMLTRPEGLWPSEARKRELKDAEELAAVPAAGG